MTSPTQTGGLDLDDAGATALEWAKTHSRQLGIGVIVVAALAGVLWVVRSQQEGNELTASRQLVAAQRSVGAGNLPLAAADLRKLVDRYGSTRAGREAQVLLAQVELQQGKTADALKVLDEMGSGGAQAGSMHALRAAALEQTGKPAEAAAEYLKASAATSLSGEAESLRADAARAYLAAGKKDEALRIWKDMAANPASVLYSEALLRVGELSAQVQK
ncbi:MAG: tetratricopeptide repeat protein [Gemmatimonadaceae bacterium]|nr:tetratricopeptide repeat protein [Gemmatimonadaceae bacterium]